MERLLFQLSGPSIDEAVVNEEVAVIDQENYNTALARSLKKAQSDINKILTELIDEAQTKRSKGLDAEKTPKKIKRS